MKKAIIFVVFILVAAFAFAVPRNHKCPICSGTMRWTGETDVEWGKLTYQMKCPAGHVSWEVDDFNNSSSRSINKNGCQYDGSTMMWTGKTKKPSGGNC